MAARQGAIPVEFLMVRRGDRWRAVDLVISGVSLVGNYRVQFNKVIEGADALRITGWPR